MQRLFAPALKSAKNVNDGIQFTWGAVSGARSYYVYRKTATTGWVLLGTSTTTTYLDKTAQPGVKYTYTARAVHNKYISTYQSGISVTRLTTPKITGVSNSNNGIYVKWGKVTGATEYRVYRKTLNSGWKYIATTKNNYYTDTAIKNNCGYYYGYTIIAVNGKTWSTFDNNGVMTKRLFTPVLKSASGTGSGIKVEWGSVYGAAGYNVYRKTANSGWVLIGKASGTSYVDATAVQGTTYTYTVRAYYNNYLSNYNTKGLTAKDEVLYDAENVTRPSDTDARYVLNTDSMKFHYPSCSSAEKISAENYAESNSDRETLINQGYSPCGNCHP